MKKLLWVCLVIVLMYAPVKKVDISQLEAIETIVLTLTEDAVVLQTDTGAVGRGVNIENALENLELSTNNVIYINTARYLLVSDEALPWVEGIRPYVPGDILLGEYGGGDIVEETKYMANHCKMTKLSAWKYMETVNNDKVEK